MKIEFEFLKSVGELEQKPLVKNLPSPVSGLEIVKVDDMSEAMERNLKQDPPASIIMTQCHEGGGCMYINDCPILDWVNDNIYYALKAGIVPATEIRFCESFKDRQMWSRGRF